MLDVILSQRPKIQTLFLVQVTGEGLHELLVERLDPVVKGRSLRSILLESVDIIAIINALICFLLLFFFIIVVLFLFIIITFPVHVLFLLLASAA